MISCAVLENPGKWRVVGLTAGLCLALAPSLALLVSINAPAQAGFSAVLTAGFAATIIRSLAVAAAAALCSLVVGLPTGVLAGLYDFPLRRLLLALLALPLLLPSFITAIGLSMLRRLLGLPPDAFLSGFTGTTLAFTSFGLPLVIFVALASVRGISHSQVDAARLGGGEFHLFYSVAHAVFLPAALTSVLAGVFTLSDPGPGQILGCTGVASEILTSFASQYDFTLAARQCSILAGVVLLLGLPVALTLAPHMAAGLLAHDAAPVPLARVRPIARIGPVWLGVLLLVLVAAPLAGFAQPLLRTFPAERAFQELERTFGHTAYYGILASLAATALGIALALCAGRDARLRVALLASLLLLFALPPSLGALGWIQLAGVSSARFDPLLRSSFTVSFALALRFFPVAVIFAMRSFGTTSPSWAHAGAIHGVPLRTYLRKVLAPWLAGAMLPASVLIALLAVADVGSVLLLHPPGKPSLPLAIFTVMANAPESLVGALCLSYVAVAAMLLALGLFLAKLANRYA